MASINLGRVRGYNGDNVVVTETANTATDHRIKFEQKKHDGTLVNSVETPNLRVNTEVIFNTVYPVGIFITQYPGMPEPSVLFSEANGYPPNVWESKFDDESIFFRTKGVYSDDFNKAEFQVDTVKNHLHVSPYSVMGHLNNKFRYYTTVEGVTDTVDNILHSFYSLNTDSFNLNGIGATAHYTINYTSSTGSSEGRPRNRTKVIWERIS